MTSNKRLILILTIISVFAVACGSGGSVAAPTATPEAVAQATDTPIPPEPTNTPLPPTDTSASQETTDEAAEEETASTEEEPAVETASSVETDTSDAEADSVLAAEAELGVAKNGKPLLDDEPRFPYESYWTTDFSRHTVPYSEILSGGPPRDGIPPIDNPQFISADEASAWLADQEPVFAVSVNGETRGYPLQILTWHEVVNDTVGGEPVAVTFCPLCNSAVTFERTLNGTVYDFGVSGKLRNSDLIMWDRQTESWWQQLTGESIVGELVGEQLAFIPTRLISWADFKSAFPDAPVLSRDTGFSRPYGQNPYAGYDSTQRPFLFAGEADPRLAPVDRVVAVDLNDEFVAYPYKVLVKENVVADTVGGEEIVVFWERGTTSALDKASIADSKDVGSATVYSPILEGEKLTFSWDGTSFVDDQTQSRWNIFGEAIAGELAGQQLTPVLHANHFWFAWAAFRPDTRIYTP